MNIALNIATSWADKIIAACAPYCDQIQVAGSIRRQRPIVHDIDIVARPADRNGLMARIRKNGQVLESGRHNTKIILPDGLQIDFWIAEPDRRELFETIPTNYGSLLLCRTGSKEFNIWLCCKAAQKGYHWNPQWGIYHNGHCIASASEQDIFKALDTPFIPPEQREIPR